MFRKLPLLLLLMFFTFAVKGQMINISSVSGESGFNICLGRKVYLAYTLNGTFNQDNTFKVQVKSSYTNLWVDVIAKDSSGYLVGTLPSEIYNISNNYSNYADLRIVSSSPNITSNVSTYQYVYTPANVELMEIRKKVLFPYEPTELKLKYSGSFPIKLLTSDSIYVDVSNEYPNQPTVVTPSKSGTFSILSVSNLCGNGKSSGSVDIKVVDNSLRVTGLSNVNICKNSKIELSILKTGKWTESNKFTIRLSPTNSTLLNSYDLVATENGGLISAIVDNTVLNGSYYVKVLASDNNVESNNFVNPIYVRNESKVDLVTASSSIKYGESKELFVSVEGYGYYSVELSDGQTYTNYYVGDYTGNVSFAVFPKESTQFYIKSFSSECGIGVGKNKVSITVDKAIKTDTLKAGKYCEGATVEVGFTTNALLPVGSSVKVKLTNSSYLDNAQYREVTAKVVRDNVASFVIPINLRNNFYSTSYYASVYTDDISGVNVSANFITINAIPSGEINNASSVVMNQKSPQNVYIDMILKGGGPYEMILTDSLKYKYDPDGSYGDSYISLPVFVPKTAVVAIKSISNVCGTNSTPYSTYKYVVVENPDYNIQIVSKKYQTAEVCAGEKIDLSVLTKGKFGDDNQFSVDLMYENSQNVIKTIGTTSPGNMQITIPSDITTGQYVIRVSSSNPLMYSNLYRVLVKTLPTAEYSTYYSSTVSYGDNVYTYLNLKGGGTQTVIFNDGTKGEYWTYQYDGTSNFSNQRKMTKTTTFGIKSVTNVCGVGKVLSKDFTINVIPYTIENKVSYNNYTQCSANNLIVPFLIRGQQPSNLSLSVQISNSTDTTYTTLKSGITASPAIVSLPSNFKQGTYSIRLISNDNNIKSDVSNVALVPTPNISLQLYDGSTSTEIQAGSTVTLYSNSSANNSNPGGILRYIISDDKNYKTLGKSGYNSFQENRSPLATTTYKLIAVANDCGVGNASGSVKVTVKPVLNMNFKSGGLANICAGTSEEIILNSYGTFEADNVFKVYLIDENNVKKEVLNTKKNGNYTLSFGNDLSKGVYKIQMESSNPYQLKEMHNLSLTTKADVSILGGSIVNPGEYAFLLLKNNDTFKPKANTYFRETVAYELSNGTIGFVEFNNSYIQSSIYIYPTKTETFTLKSVRNACGLGKVSGSATITVNPSSNKQINIYDYHSNFCAGSTFNVYFFTVGSFSASNKFTVQLSDATGSNFKNIETTGTESPLKVKIPLDLTPSAGYNFRVIASDSNATSTTNKLPLTAYEGITARFDSSSYYFNENKPVSIGIKFTGTPPFNFTLGSDEVNAKLLTSTVNDYTLRINPTANTTYRLFSVNNNVCGTGTVLSPSTVRIELITATDELGKMGINIFPNPASDVLNIESNDQELDVQLIDFVGKIVQEQIVRGVQKQVDLSKIPSGTYFLNIQKDGRKATFKVLKQ